MNTENRIGDRIWILGLLLLAGLANQHLQAEQTNEEKIVIRAWVVPSEEKTWYQKCCRAVIDAFHSKHPNVSIVKAHCRKYLTTAGAYGSASSMFQDVCCAGLRWSNTMIEEGSLYPLDKYLERQLGFDLADGPNMTLAEYVEALKTSPRYALEIERRIPQQCWQIIRRLCPYGKKCPYCVEWSIEAKPAHYHVWTIPNTPMVIALRYRKDYFKEAGLPDRAPETLEEMFTWAKKLTDRKKKRFGLHLPMVEPSWSTSWILFSHGGRFLKEISPGKWRYCFDSKQAIDAYTFVARLVMEPFEVSGQRTVGVLCTDRVSRDNDAMSIPYLTPLMIPDKDPQKYGYAPVPQGPTGLSSSEFNCYMTGLSIRLAERPKQRDLAWQFMYFISSIEANRVGARTAVAEGVGKLLSPTILRDIERPDLITEQNRDWDQFWANISKNAVPEHYGEGAQFTYKVVSRAINEILANNKVRMAIEGNDLDTARKIIAGILKTHVTEANSALDWKDKNKLPQY